MRDGLRISEMNHLLDGVKAGKTFDEIALKFAGDVDLRAIKADHYAKAKAEHEATLVKSAPKEAPKAGAVTKL